MSNETPTITDEQARIIGAEIGRKIAYQLSQDFGRLLFDSSYNLQHRIADSIKDGFDAVGSKLEPHVRKGFQRIADAVKAAT